jgi:hypothetical protein
MQDLALLEERDRKIDALEAGIRELAPVEFVTVDHFSKGVYARELHIPAGTVLTGKVHKYENLNILSKGEMSVHMEDGSVLRVCAPYTVVSPPGTRRAAFAHSDCVWTTIHGTDEKDVEVIEKLFVAASPADYRLFVQEQQRIAMEGDK